MQNDYEIALKILEPTGISLLDAARLIRNALDYNKSVRDNLTFCRDIIELGKQHIYGNVRISLEEAFKSYLEYKQYLRPDSLRDIRYLGRKILKIAGKVWVGNFSTARCNEILNSIFLTPSQFNKGRIMLHGLFSYCVMQEWRMDNPVAKVRPKRIIENEIRPLKMEEISRLVKSAEKPENNSCAAAFGIMLWAGVRPKEVLRMKWADINLKEKIIVIRARNSKTGGIRHIDICPALLKWLRKFRESSENSICPKNWTRKWRNLRKDAGITDWIHDILRHTFASYTLKRYKNLNSLQYSMGHSGLSLLKTRYVNMADITKDDAKNFCEGFFTCLKHNATRIQYKKNLN